MAGARQLPEDEFTAAGARPIADRRRRMSGTRRTGPTMNRLADHGRARAAIEPGPTRDHAVHDGVHDANVGKWERGAQTARVECPWVVDAVDVHDRHRPG